MWRLLKPLASWVWLLFASVISWGHDFFMEIQKNKKELIFTHIFFNIHTLFFSFLFLTFSVDSVFFFPKKKKCEYRKWECENQFPNKISLSLNLGTHFFHGGL